jgi:GDP-L-fucose synthase
MKMNKTKLLVLGGTGFIGQNILKIFAELNQYEIHATYHSRLPIDIPNITWHKVDLRIPSEVNELIVDQEIVIQAAATTSGIAEMVSRVDYHITDNVIMNSTILRRVNEVKVKNFIFFSCITMLQSSTEAQRECDFSESDEIHPRYFGIGWTKVYIEKLCEYYSRQNSGTKYSVIRHSNVFGPGDKFNLKNSHVLGATITKVLTSAETVEVWGSGEEFRDFIYIADLVDFVLKLIEKQKKEFVLLNCGGTAFISVLNLTKKVIELSGRENHISIVLNPSGPTVDFSARVDTSLAEKEIGWRPTTSFEDALNQTLDYWAAKSVCDPNWPY